MWTIPTWTVPTWTPRIVHDALPSEGFNGKPNCPSTTGTVVRGPALR
jgi:hypothetical protein